MYQLRTYLADLYRREPARINAAIAAVVMTASLSLGVVLDATVVSAAVGAVLSLLLTGEGTRAKVVPAEAVEQVVTDVPREIA